jgi:hypothetical protein
MVPEKASRIPESVSSKSLCGARVISHYRDISTGFFGSVFFMYLLTILGPDLEAERLSTFFLYLQSYLNFLGKICLPTS